ncbi:MAG: spike base protein, RCAP_Rcc01079 family [Halocynthiibacter sp.]
MNNPFENRIQSLSGPAMDVLPVSPSDSADLSHVALALYIETGGMLSIETIAGHTRNITMADFSMLPVGVTRVNATGTTATGIHAMVIE